MLIGSHIIRGQWINGWMEGQVDKSPQSTMPDQYSFTLNCGFNSVSVPQPRPIILNNYLFVISYS